MKNCIRFIILMLAVIACNPNAAADGTIDEKINGIWVLPFSFKHNDEHMKGTIYIEFRASDHVVRLTQSFNIGATPNAAFKSYLGIWKANSSRLAIRYNNESDIQWTLAVASRLEQEGVNEYWASRVINEIGNSFPGLSRIGLDGILTIRSITATELRLSSASLSKTLVFKKAQGYPKGTLPPFTPSTKMEKAISGWWITDMSSFGFGSNSKGRVNFNHADHTMEMSVSSPEWGQYCFNVTFTWRASNNALYYSYLPESAKFTDGDVSLSLSGYDVPEELSQINQILEIISAFNKVIGCPINLSGDKLVVGGCGPNKAEVYTRLTQAP